MRNARKIQSQSQPDRPLLVQSRTYVNVVNGRMRIPMSATNADPIACSK